MFGAAVESLMASLSEFVIITEQRIFYLVCDTNVTSVNPPPTIAKKSCRRPRRAGAPSLCGGGCRYSSFWRMSVMPLELDSSSNEEDNVNRLSFFPRGETNPMNSTQRHHQHRDPTTSKRRRQHIQFQRSTDTKAYERSLLTLISEI